MSALGGGRPALFATSGRSIDQRAEPVDQLLDRERPLDEARERILEQ
ncbi:MAG: hypothetical protein OXT09_09255 [Myxococcales bacterium]|nr:hypothetical protein [Myxococcales bacterium]